jgi:ribosomal protein RSM22 (predicted rRNA methylase)
MINLGKKLNPQVNWIQSNYLKENLPMADLVLGSYTFSELPKTDLEMALEKSWQTTKQCLVLIEPGTPEGFQTILKCRDYLIKNGGFIYAPCGHNGSCPIGLKNDWCHFSARLERSKLHRDMKEGSLPYEDEKYSYLVATKENWKPTYQRILRPSMTRKGHIVLDVCTPENIESKTYTKSKDKNFKDIKKLNWGDRLEIPK